MKFWQFLADHRTKILGLAQAIVGAIMTYLGNIQAFIKPLTYGLIMMGLGITTTIMGFFNSLRRDR